MGVDTDPQISSHDTNNSSEAIVLDNHCALILQSIVPLHCHLRVILPFYPLFHFHSTPWKSRY